jgi:cytokinin riboside 5'-monophosphate phosphoribohydrolase
MNICVFCSSSNAVDTAFFKQARQLGEIIGAKGHKLVFGGSNVGLMHELASAVKDAGGKVLGVIPERIKDKGLASEISDELIVSTDMSERKKIMADRSDAFIALPGGFGTLEEILEVITLKQLQYHNKPVVFINTNGFYDKLMEFFEVFYKNYFAKPDYREYYKLADSVQEAVSYLQEYKAPDFKDKWYWVGSEEFRK